MQDLATSKPFSDMSVSLRSQDVMDAAGDMLLRLIQYGNWRRARNPIITGTVNIKIFLAAYMIGAHPQHVFESADGELEKKVLDASSPFVELFHRIAKGLSEGKSWHSLALKKELSDHMCTYLRTFKVSYTCVHLVLESVMKQTMSLCVCVCVCVFGFHPTSDGNLFLRV